jgi:hypothetical protein
MQRELITTAITVTGFISATAISLIRLTAKAVTLNNRLNEMEKDYKDMAKKQEEDIRDLKLTVKTHEKNVTILTTQMVDVKNNLLEINRKLDQLLTASKF